ncbi:MAG: hypothetical protein NT069_21315 [Planctomycetota bacterium]|nr:hypothetical protein [Planctomycetota bacterium]
MRKLLKAATLLLIVAGSFSAVQAGPITYQINNYPSVQNGFTVSGSITTDGTIGSLSSGNITAWTWTLSTGSTVHGTLSSTDAGATLGTDGTVTATATDITLTSPGANLVNQLSFFSTTQTAQFGVALRYIRNGGDPGEPLDANDIYRSSYTSVAFATSSSNPPGVALPSVATWVIASVPPPPPPAAPGTLDVRDGGPGGPGRRPPWCSPPEEPRCLS